MQLVTMMAKACHYAQEHIDDADAWPQDSGSREQLLQCVSFQMACFLAQNTGDGRQGVDWSIVIDDLVEPLRTEAEWETILEELAEDLGGWKK